MDHNSKTKTFKEELENAKKRKTTTGFSINNVPLWLLKDFVKDAKEKYNDVYWVTLMDYKRKAEAYDAFIAGQVELPEEEIPEETMSDEEEVKTMGGLR